MTETIIPPPPAETPGSWHPELEPRVPWWRRGRVLLVVAIAIVAIAVVGGLVVYRATRPSEREQFVEDLQEEGFSEADAEQMVSEFEELAEGELGELGEALWYEDPNDGYLSGVEIEAARMSYTLIRGTEVGELAGLPDESVFTDEQIRAWTAELCEILSDSDAPLEAQIRIAEAFADEPNPEAAAGLAGSGASWFCRAAMDESVLFD